MVTLPDKSYSRVIIIQILYILNLSNTDIKALSEESIEAHIADLKNFYDSANSDDSEIVAVMKKKAKHQFIKSVLMCLGEKIEIIDEAILKHISNKNSWLRMNVIIKSILRAAIAE
jgi:transcription termination factor NusB